MVCGHIHFAEIRDIGGISYCNDGDWVESCTALVEHLDGKLEIVRWMERARSIRCARRARTRSEPDARPELEPALADAVRALRIALVTDAWPPQVNGVVRTLAMLVHELRRWAMRSTP